jgi:hypothetical protein
MVIVFGVERDTRTTVDQGAAPQAASDYLHMEGEKEHVHPRRARPALHRL